jgi:hypothetical protein
MLKEISFLIKEKKFKLVLFQQIKEEFFRNKYGNAVYKDHILQLESRLDVNFVAPAILKNSRHEQRISAVVEKLRKYKKEIISEYKNRVFNEQSNLNKGFKKLFSAAEYIELNEEILKRAHFRTLRGNPPRKGNDSFGDAIIWESVLEYCIDDDVVFISGDGDFESEISKEKINEFLLDEWGQKTPKKFEFYTNLGSFINGQLPKNKKSSITEEDIHEEKEELVTSYQRPLLVSAVKNVADNYLENSVYNVWDSVCAVGSTKVHGANECICCSAVIDDSIGILGHSRCQNCRYSTGSGFICSRCGRHFHIDMISVTNSVYVSTSNTSKCKECQKII